MGAGDSYWLKDKAPVKLHAFHTGGIFTPSGWYFEAPGLHRRFRLKSSELKKLMFEHKAYVIIDKEEIEKLIAKYRGEDKKKKKAKADPKAAAEQQRKAEEERRKQLEAERKRQEEATKKRKEYEKQRAIFEEKRKAAEEQRQQLESAKKAAAEAKKTT